MFSRPAGFGRVHGRSGTKLGASIRRDIQGSELAGSHRSEQKKEPIKRSGRPARKKSAHRLSKRTLAIAAGIALLPAIWLGGSRLLDSSDDTSRNQTPIPDVTSTRTPTASASPSATPAAPASTPPTPPKLTRVAASGPKRLTVQGLLGVGFDDSIEPKSGGFTAGSTAEAARWGSRGLPASPGTDTVFLIGKVYRQGASAFDDLPSVTVGKTITVRTQNGGVLTYTVQSTASRPASGLLKTAEFTAKTPGRLVLVGILFDAKDDKRTGKYLVVVAQLSGAKRG